VVESAYFQDEDEEKVTVKKTNRQKSLFSDDNLTSMNSASPFHIKASDLLGSILRQRGRLKSDIGFQSSSNLQLFTRSDIKQFNNDNILQVGF